MISLTFDIEPDLHTPTYKGITEGIPKIQCILSKHKVSATFFVTCDCIEKHPEIFQKLKREGHEIALHAYRHERFDDMPLDEKEDAIKKSIIVFQKYLNQHPQGFRAPQHSIDKHTLNLLQKYNFKYDSSKTPLNAFQFLFFPKRLKSNLSGFFSNPRKHKIGNLSEIPPTAFIIPHVSIVLRVMPNFIQKIYFSFLNLFFKEVIFYAHSWDFIPLEKSRLDRKFPHAKVIKNLDNLITKMKPKNKFVRMIELI